eukprot:SAG11_NODE_1783_length_4260_cov_5.855804_4_plen_48_part_00
MATTEEPLQAEEQAEERSQDMQASQTQAAEESAVHDFLYVLAPHICL